jgi:hypothetical protein
MATWNVIGDRIRRPGWAKMPSSMNECAFLSAEAMVPRKAVISGVAGYGTWNPLIPDQEPRNLGNKLNKANGVAELLEERPH